MDTTQIRDLIIQGPTEDFRYDGDPGNSALIYRGVTLGIGNGSYVGLPDIEKIHRFHGQYNEMLREVLGVHPSVELVQAVFYAWEDHFFLAEEGVEASAGQIAAQLNGSRYTYMPYQHTAEVTRANEALVNAGLNIQVGLPAVYSADQNSLQSNRRGWSRDLDNLDVPSIPEQFGINYPISITVNNIERLTEAYDAMVNKFNSHQVFIKIDGSAGGFGVFKAESMHDVNSIIAKLRTSDALSANYSIQVQAGINIGELFSVQYRNGEIITPGNVSNQVVDHQGRWYMNIFNTANLKRIAAGVGTQFNALRKACAAQGINLSGWGGLDGATVENHKAMFLEHNSMRLTGAIPGIEAAKSLGISHLPFAFGKVLGNNQGDLQTVWELLKAEKMGLDLNRKRGVLPALWVDHGAYVLVAGENQQDLMNQYHNAQRLFEREGLLIREG